MAFSVKYDYISFDFLWFFISIATPASIWGGPVDCIGSHMPRARDPEGRIVESLSEANWNKKQTLLDDASCVGSGVGPRRLAAAARHEAKSIYRKQGLGTKADRTFMLRLTRARNLGTHAARATNLNATAWAKATRTNLEEEIQCTSKLSSV